MLSNDEFLNKLNKNGIDHKPLEEYKGSHTNMKFQCGKNRKHIFKTTPVTIYNSKSSCPFCNRRKVFVGETDMWSTNPELATLLANKEDGYKYFESSSKKVNWKCPNCGNIVENKIINNVRTQGLSCPYCSDGMSYGEKIIFSILRQLSIDFIFDNALSWSCGKRYDFYIPQYSMIIEVHGIQHYERSFKMIQSNRKSRNVNEEKRNDIYKRKLALKNGIVSYIELDCRKSELEYIKQSILKSDLSFIFDLSFIDWNKCLENTKTSNIILCAEIWNNGIKNTKKISEMTGIHISSVISNLKKATQIGLCDYIKNYKKNQSQYKPVQCIETGKIYESIKDVKKDGFCNTFVSKCCNGWIEVAHGLHWKFI